MKNVFDYNFTAGLHDGSVFYDRRISAELDEKMDAGFGEYFEMEAKNEPSWAIKILEIVCMCIALGGAIGFTNAFIEHNVGFVEGIKNAPGFFILVIAAAIALIGIRVYAKKMQESFVEEVEGSGIVDEINSLDQLAADELQLPYDRFDLEMFCHNYEIKDGRKKLISKEIWDINLMDVYKRDDCLCFFDGRQEFALPFESIKAVEVQNEKTQIMEWLKDEDYKDKKFKKYKIRETNIGLIITQRYQIRIEHDGQQYEILVPNYEEEPMRKIVDMIKPYKQ